MMIKEDKISNQFCHLVKEGEKVARFHTESIIGFPHFTEDSQKIRAVKWVSSSKYFIGLIMGKDSDRYIDFENVEKGTPIENSRLTLLGILQSAKEDYERGFLTSYREIVTAEVFDGFLEQAEHLLKKDHLAASAVVSGGVLENGLKQLCCKHNVDSYSSRGINDLTEKLVKAGVLSRLESKEIQVLSHIRNDAAHGTWDELNKDSINDMIRKIRAILSKHCS